MTAGLETFAKVRRLHDSTTNPGEKASAAARMKTLAAKAGMTVAEAVSKLDAPQPAPRNFFDELFNSPEFKARDAVRQRERAERRAAALLEYGTEDAVFADTPREAALRMACEPLLGPGETWTTIYKLAGWGWLDSLEKMPAVLRTAVAMAWPMPETVADAWAEFHAQDKLETARYDFEPNWSPHDFVCARRYLVEDVLDAEPAKSLRDLRARMSWLDWLNELGSPGQEKQRVRLATLRADIERMGRRIREQDAGPVQSGQADEVQDHHPTLTPCRTSAENSAAASPVQSGHPHRTTADKRRDVLNLLGQGFTDREIARRVGVSPTTVGTIRRQST